MRSPKDGAPKWLVNAARVSSLPLQLVAATAVGYLLGNWLDHRFGTSPWLMVVCVMLGAIGGFIEIIRAAIRMSKEE